MASSPTGSEVLTNSLDLAFRWEPVLSDVGKPYKYPAKISRYMRMHYSGPAIYCWKLDKWGLPSSIYIGETEHMVRRLRAFRKPASDRQTNMRLQHCLIEEMVGGAEVKLEVLAFPAFSVNGFEVTMEKLGNPHVRKLVETIAVLTELAQGSVVLNLGRNLEEKQRERLVRWVPKMRPLEREKFLRMWAAKAGMLTVK